MGNKNAKKKKDPTQLLDVSIKNLIYSRIGIPENFTYQPYLRI